MNTQPLEIDYSAISQEASGVVDVDSWDPPIHKFFGKRLPNGKMEKEPVYSHQEYPRLMYSLSGNKIIARVANSDAEVRALGEGWEKTPGVFGYISAPSHDEHLALIGSDAAKPEIVEAVRIKRKYERKAVV